MICALSVWRMHAPVFWISIPVGPINVLHEADLKHRCSMGKGRLWFFNRTPLSDAFAYILPSQGGVRHWQHQAL